MNWGRGWNNDPPQGGQTYKSESQRAGAPDRSLESFFFSFVILYTHYSEGIKITYLNVLVLHGVFFITSLLRFTAASSVRPLTFLLPPRPWGSCGCPPFPPPPALPGRRLHSLLTLCAFETSCYFLARFCVYYCLHWRALHTLGSTFVSLQHNWNLFLRNLWRGKPG